MAPLFGIGTYYDPLHQGYTRRGVAFGLTAACGRDWCIPGQQGADRIACVALFRGTQKASSIDYTAPVGLALGKAASVKNFTFRGHAPDTWYAYEARPLI